MRGIITASDSCWGEEDLKKRHPQKITVRDSPDIKLREDDPLEELNIGFYNIEYGLTIATYIFNRVDCTVYFDELVKDIIPHIDSILIRIINEILNKQGAVSREEADIQNSIFGEIEGNDNWIEDEAIKERVLHCVLNYETIIRRLYMNSYDYKNFLELNLFLYLIHHEANHCASALLTWRRNSCSLNAWAEIWIDFCTFLEVNDFFVGSESEYDVPNNLNIYRSKQKHMQFVEYIIDRAIKKGKSQEDIFKAIWRYCFDKRIEAKEAQEILSGALSIDEENIIKLEQKMKIDEVINYCNNHVTSFHF